MTNQNIATFDINSDKYRDARPLYPEALYCHLFDLCNGFDTAWDCGCGNGQVAIALASKFGRIEASDISLNQIVNSFRHEAIRYSVQRSEKPAFADKSFDLICTAQCLHWFDLDKFFSEARRTLKPGGIFACWGYGFLSVNETVDAFLRDSLYAPIDKHWAPGNRIVQNGYRDISFPFAHIRIPPIEMRMKWTAGQLANYFATWSAVKIYDAENRSDIVGALLPHLNDLVSGSVNVKFDFSTFIGRS